MMDRHHARRLGAVGRHFAALPQPAATEHEASAAPQERAAPAAPQLLSDRDVREFVRTGFCVVHVCEFPKEWHERAYAKAAAVSAESGANQHVVWDEMTPEINAVIRAPSVRGALTSMLGADYLYSGGGHMHVTGATDQQHHKDGTGKGVREHEPQSVICMYYATDTTIEMGATCLVPSSQYYSVDREGWFQSEDRLENGGHSLDEDAPTTGEASLERWRGLAQATGGVGSIEDDDEREAKLAGCIANLGMAPASQLRMVVPAGSFLVMHSHCYHRGGRAWPGAKWRPMFKMGASRVSDPVQPTWSQCEAGDDDEHPFAYTGEPEPVQRVYEHTYAWLCGRSVTAHITDEDSAAAHAVLTDIEASEVSRVAAAYTLGTAGQVDALLATRVHPREQVRRATCYGLRALVRCGGGPAQDKAVAVLLDSLRSGFELANGAVSGSVAALHSLAFAQPSEEIVRCLEDFVQRTLAEIERHTAAQSQEQLQEWAPLLPNRYQSEVAIDFDITDRRKALAEASATLAALGEAALRQAATLTNGAERSVSSLAVRATTVIAGLACAEEEPGVAFPSFLGHTVVCGQAAVALLQLCSDPQRVGASTPSRREVPEDWQNPGPKFNAVSQTVAEALRRLRSLVAEGPLESAPGRAEMLALLEGVDWPWDVSVSPHMPIAEQVMG